MGTSPAGSPVRIADRCGEGGGAWRWLNRSATEWSAARRKQSRAAAMHPGAANFADVQARGFRRANARREMGTFLISPLRGQKGTDLQQVCPLLLGNEECPHFSSGVRSSEAYGP